MDIIIQTKNLDLTPSLRELVAEKIGKAERFIAVLKKDAGDSLKSPAQLQVDVKRETNHHRKGDVYAVEAVLTLPGDKLVATAQGDDIAKLCVQAGEQLEQEIKKYKTKHVEVPRRKFRQVKNEQA